VKFSSHFYESKQNQLNGALGDDIAKGKFISIRTLMSHFSEGVTRDLALGTQTKKNNNKKRDEKMSTKQSR
jgi:hypothetical protein